MIPHNRPTIGNREIKEVSKIISSKNISKGTEVRKFEEEFAEYLNISDENVVAVNNGTSALYLALWVLNSKNKRVYYPTYSCSSLRNANHLINGQEKLLDIKSNSPNISLETFKKSSRVIVPHMYGFPSLIKKNKNVFFIEDACQSLGSKYRGNSIIMGNISIYSFYATKIITSAGQGGMLASNDKGLIGEIKDYLDFDQRKDKKNRFNFQMTDIQASMGRVQLDRIEEFIEKRRQIFNYYKQLKLPLLDINYKKNTFEPVRYRAIILSKNQKIIIKKLKTLGVTAINPLEKWELLSDKKKFTNSINLTKNTISLPCFPSLKKKDLKHIEQALDKISKYI